jgi:hypothetical protein
VTDRESLFEIAVRAREGRIIAAAEAFVDAQETQRGWGEDYDFPSDEYAALKAAVEETKPRQ